MIGAARILCAGLIAAGVCGCLPSVPVTRGRLVPDQLRLLTPEPQPVPAEP